MISRIDHVAIAVQDFDKASDFLTGVFGAVPGTGSEDTSMRYYWQNMALGDLTRLELLAPTGDGSFLDAFLKNRAGGVHHITLQTSDIHAAREHLESAGVPYFGFNDAWDVWKELFIHPKDAFGVLFQIAEFEADDWLSESVKMPPGKRWNVDHTESGCEVNFSHPGGGTARLSFSKEEIRELIRDLEDAL